MTPHGALKVALCFQATTLIVLTSILAQGGAWIGVSISAMGLCFVMVGVGAAHKRSLGYLYCYATLVGIWELLALTHVLIICSLLPLPESMINPVLFVGEKLAQAEPSLAMLIVLPVLYGLHWSGWCASLVCMVCLRLSVLDPTLDFEIHDPKHEMALEDSGSIYHTIHEMPPGYNGPLRGSQHRFNFRQSVISPLCVRPNLVTAGAVARSGGEGFHHSTEKGKGKGESDHDPMFSSLSSPPLSRKWSGTAGALRVEGARASSEEVHSRGLYEAQTNAAIPAAGGGLHTNGSSSAIYIPNDHRISQVLVTFKDGQHAVQQQQQQQQIQPLAGSNVTAENIRTTGTEATTVYITNNHHVPVTQPPTAPSFESEPCQRSNGVNNQNKDFYLLNLSPSFSQSIEELSGESFGDMVLKHVEQVVPPINGIPGSACNSAATAPASTTLKTTVSEDSASSSGSPQKREATRVCENAMASLAMAKETKPNPRKITATDTKASFALSSDTCSSERSVLSDASSSSSVEAVDSDERTVYQDQAKYPPALPSVPAHDPAFETADMFSQDSDSTRDRAVPKAAAAAIASTAADSGVALPTQNFSSITVHHPQLTDRRFSEDEETFDDGEDNMKYDDDQMECKPRASFSEGVDETKERDPAAVLKRFSHPVVPVRRSSMSHHQERAIGQLADEEEEYSDSGDNTTYQEHEWDSNEMELCNTADSYHTSSSRFAQYTVSQMDGNVPTIQPNSSDSSPSISSMATSDSSDTRSDLSDSNVTVSPSTSSNCSSSSSSGGSGGQAKSKTSLASLPLQYWRSRQSSSSLNASDSVSSTSSSSSSSFTQQILPFGKKKNKIQIPTIVLHPDEEDDEPPRVLSAKDIEYLSTMPPPPLRPLVQPWDEYPEEEEEDDMNGGYDYDDYHDPHPQEYAYHVSHHQHDTQQQQQQQQQHHHQYHQEQPHHYHQQQHHHQQQQHHTHHQQTSVLHHGLDDGFDEETECNPYAFDVPIDLPPELQDSLEREEVKIGYGYI